jgi:leucine-rich repeat protein SHOC2
MSAKTAELARLIEKMTPDTTVLDLRGYGLETLPENIGTLTHLTKLNLNGNRLTSLPESIGNLTNLTELYLNGHKLTALPESIGNLTNLTRLDLNGDRLESLPDSIANLTKLTELNLNGNRLVRIPDILIEFPNLKTINLDNNPITDLSEIKYISNLKILRSYTKSKFKIVKFKNSTRIVIGDRYLDEILADLNNFTSLISLGLGSYGSIILKNGDTCQVLSGKEVEKILFDLGKLPNLIFLTWHVNLLAYRSIIILSSSSYNVSFYGIFLSRNQFNYLDLSSHLSIQENKWTNLSLLPQLTNLTSVSYCGLNDTTSLRSRNNIGIIGNLPYLKVLSIYGCNSINILSKISNLIRLEHLTVNSNKLKSLPDSMIDLSKLASLQIHNNSQITNLSILTELEKLRNVYFNSVYLPRRYWTKLSEWKSEWLLDENNTELRRILTEKIGYERICKELYAIELDTLQEYTLLKIDYFEPVFERGNNYCSWREPIVLLKRICPSVGHVHIRKVPSEIISVEAAVEWLSCGIHLDKFAVYI